jgi:hypothetical protein
VTGAVYYDSLDEAMEALKVPIENRSIARDLVPHGPVEIWIPPASTYIAIKPQGDRGVRIYVNRRLIDRKLAPNKYERTWMRNGVADGPYER